MPINPPDLGPLLTGAPGGPQALSDELGASTYPLALFPVRLETRFFAVPGGAAELRIRVYPDKIHLDSHDPVLTDDELTWGQRYWQLQWHAGADDQRLREAWRMLAGRFGPQRAAWLVRALTPANPTDRPAVALDPDAALPVAPSFPAAGAPATQARPAAVARLLPARWVATAYAGGAVVAMATGRDIASDLAVGPGVGDPSAPATGDETPAIDAGMSWMIDFDLAEAAGMGLRLTLPGPLASAAVDVLLVTGVAAAGANAADALVAQLDAHHYTDGIAFVPAGSPSNNTTDARTSYRAADPRQDQSYAVEVAALPVQPGTNADLATRAFGLEQTDAGVFGHLAQAAGSDAQIAAAMATAIWPVTWGYFLAQMIGFDGTGLTVAARDWARDHAIGHLRPGGPLPVLRCGRQPYGILPVSSLDRWTPAADADAGGTRLRDLLVTLRDRVWRPASAGVPRVGQTDDPTADLVDVLQSGPLSTGYLSRGLMGQHFLQHLTAFLGEGLDGAGFWPQLVRLTSREPAALGLGVPALAHAAYEPTARQVTAPLVSADGAPAAYLADLLAAADLDALAAPVPATPAPVLQALARHALLREYAEAAARLLDAPATPVTQLLRDTELVDLLPGLPPTPTWGWQRAQPMPGTAGTVRERLSDVTGEPAPATRSLAQTRDALGVLAAAAGDVEALERHLAGALDAAAYRLDAWITSLADRRLAEVRAAQPNGVAIGGYGWLENLRPATAGVTATPLPDEPGPLVTPAADPGFIHAPSLNQASAAALMRNAHLAHGGAADSPYAIDLSSARIRLARHLFEGVRQGQPLGALLGYTVERALHDAGLDGFVDDLRSAYPLPGASAPAGDRRLVVDGLALAQAWQKGPNDVLAALTGLTPTDSRRAAVAKILGDLQTAIDSAADAVNAEAAFQLARGNPARAAGALDAISSGEVPPPDLGFAATPRTGTGLTHRVAMVLDAAGGPVPPGWADRSASPRARTDPVLDSWAGRLLGPATGISARVEELAPDGSVTATHLIALEDLGLSAIDFVWASASAGAEIVQRVLDAARHPAGTGTPPAGTSLRVDLARLPGSGPADRGLGDLVELAAQARGLLAGARPLDGADFQPPHADPQRGLDLDEYQQRVSAAEQALASARGSLQAAITNATPGGPAQPLRTAMLAAAGFGVSGAVPATPAPGSDEAAGLAAQASAALGEIDRRLADLAAAAAAAADETDGTRRDRLQQRLGMVFGQGFVALPRFTAANAADLAASRADASLHADDPLAAYTWLQLMERVRPPLARLGRPMQEAEALGSGEGLNLSIAQIPHVPGQRWAGLPQGDTAADGPGVPDGCASLVLQGAPADLAGQLCGLLVDEWTEVVPSRNETTGIAFQYDPPDACAPQAILLAVPPVIGEPWQVGTLNRVLLETLDLARLRGVDPAALGDVAHYLPAIYLAFNVNADAVSTDPNPLAP